MGVAMQEQPANHSMDQRRRRNFHLSLLALVFASALGNFAYQMVGSPFVLSRLPYEPWIHSATQWAASGITVLFGSLREVMICQLLVWWLWRPARQPKRSAGVALVVCMAMGAVLQLYGHVLAIGIFSQRGDVSYFEPSLFTQSLILVPWTLCLLAAFWVTVKAAQPFMGFRLIDVADDRVDQPLADRSRTWSILELMAATLLIAIVIATYQLLNRFQQQTINAPFAAYLGWIQLIQVVAYCLTNLIVLWAAARYCLGGSSFVGYLSLVLATAIQIGEKFAMTSLYGASYVIPQNYRAIIDAAIQVALMFAIHVWLFRKWEQVGYQLRRCD